MLSDKIFELILKSALIALLAVFVLYMVGRQFLGPGISDFSKPIINGYEYSDAGGYEKMIIYRGGERPPKMVIDSRVDSYKIEGDMLIVARRPRGTFYEENQDQVLSSRLSGDCEHWVINVKTHFVEKTNEVHGLRCN